MITPVQSPEEQLAIILGQRQLIVICCMGVMVLGLVATLAYVCGRSISAAQFKQEQQLPASAIVVESAKPSIMEAKAETKPEPKPLPPQPVRAAPTPVPVPVATVPVTQSALGEPLRGSTYWQVGLVDRGVATVFAEFLTRLGLKVRVAAGDSPSTHRVLVGPLPDAAETEAARKTLQSAGFQYFLRRY